MITHVLGVAAEIADGVAMAYAGRVVESGPLARIINEPQHPCTAGADGLHPDHRGAAGTISDHPRRRACSRGHANGRPLRQPVPPCRFALRCRASAPPDRHGGPRHACLKAPLEEHVDLPRQGAPAREGPHERHEPADAAPAAPLRHRRRAVAQGRHDPRGQRHVAVDPAGRDLRHPGQTGLRQIHPRAAPPEAGRCCRRSRCRYPRGRRIDPAGRWAATCRPRRTRPPEAAPTPSVRMPPTCAAASAPRFPRSPPAGAIPAMKKGTPIDDSVNVVALSGLSIPDFRLAPLLIRLVSVDLG